MAYNGKHSKRSTRKRCHNMNQTTTHPTWGTLQQHQVREPAARGKPLIAARLQRKIAVLQVQAQPKPPTKPNTYAVASADKDRLLEQIAGGIV
jgi:hypothetical protein